MIEEIELFSHIHCLYRVKNTQGLDSILALTHSHNLFHLSYKDFALKKTLIDLKTNFKAVNAKNFLMALNSSQNLLAVSNYVASIRILKIKQGKFMEKDTFFIDNKGYSVEDLEFLIDKDVLVALFLSPDNFKTIIMFYRVLTEVQSYESLQTYEFQEKPGKIIVSRVEDLIIFMENSCRVFNSSTLTFEIIEGRFSTVTSKCEVDKTRFVIGNDLGKLFLVLIGPTVDIKTLGHSNSPNSIAYLDNNIFFLGCKSSHSKVIQILSDPTDGTHIKELQEITGLSPIYDLKVIEDNDLGILNILTCSGTGLGGGFCKITKAVSVYIECQYEIPNITGI